MVGKAHIVKEPEIGRESIVIEIPFDEVSDESYLRILKDIGAKIEEDKS